MMEVLCRVCDREVRPRQHAVTCDTCDRWQHRLCDTGISLKHYKAAVRGRKELSFICRQCSGPINTEEEVSNLNDTFLSQSHPAEIPVILITLHSPHSQAIGSVNIKSVKTPSKEETLPVLENAHSTELKEIEQTTLPSSTTNLKSTDSREPVSIRHRPVNKQPAHVKAQFLCSALSSDSSSDSDDSSTSPKRSKSSRNTTQAMPTSRCSSSSVRVRAKFLCSALSSDSSSDSDDSPASTQRLQSSGNTTQAISMSRCSSSSSDSSSASDNYSASHKRCRNVRNNANVIQTILSSSSSSDSSSDSNDAPIIHHHRFEDFKKKELVLPTFRYISSSDSDSPSAIPQRFQNTRNNALMEPSRSWSPEWSEIRRQAVASRPIKIPQINSAFPETGINHDVGVSNHANKGDLPISYRVIENGSSRGKDMLTDTHGYTFSVKKRNYSRTYWRCSIRSKNLMCRAAVTQRRNSFWTNNIQHNHLPKLNRANDAELCAKIRNKVQTVSSSHRSARSIVEETVSKQNSPISKERMALLIRRTNNIRAKHRRAATLTEQYNVNKLGTNFLSTTQKLLQPPRETPVNAEPDCIRGGEEFRPF